MVAWLFGPLTIQSPTSTAVPGVAGTVVPRAVTEPAGVVYAIARFAVMSVNVTTSTIAKCKILLLVMEKHLLRANCFCAAHLYRLIFPCQTLKH